MQEMLSIAKKEGIKVERWNFEPPILGIYWEPPDLPPFIGLDDSLEHNRSLCRCVMAEELGHHFTTVGRFVSHTYFHYRERLSVSRAEYRALRWAAGYLMPYDRLGQAYLRGIRERWELAEYFSVTEQMIDFRLRLPDVRA